MTNFRRLRQVLQYGWKDATNISQEQGVNLSRVGIFFDILYCFLIFNLWSNQYKKEKFYLLDRVKRKEIGEEYKQRNKQREEWLHDYFENHRFLNKWSSFKYEKTAQLQHKRIGAYRKRYNIGEHCHIGHDVIIDRHHYLNGTIQVGDHVFVFKTRTYRLHRRCDN